MLRLLCLFLLLPAVSFAQETRPDLKESGDRFPGKAMGPVAQVTSESPAVHDEDHLTVTCIRPESEIGFTLKPWHRKGFDLLVVETPVHIFRYCLLDQRGKTLSSAAIYSERKWIDLSIYPGGTYFLQVDQYSTHRIRKK